jgi:hypothetical protein
MEAISQGRAFTFCAFRAMRLWTGSGGFVNTEITLGLWPNFPIAGKTFVTSGCS